MTHWQAVFWAAIRWICSPYEWDAVPNGVTKEQYQPLDDYLDLSDDIWSDMSDVIEMFKYKDKHYVVPYCLSDPLLITYNRSCVRRTVWTILTSCTRRTSGTGTLSWT